MNFRINTITKKTQLMAFFKNNIYLNVKLTKLSILLLL